MKRHSVLFCLVFEAIASAQTANWILQIPQAKPPAQSGMSLAFDSAHSQMVLLGTSGTWLWDGANWKQQSPRTSPPPRLSGTLAYDSARGQVVLFGGLAAVTFDVLNDTWVWDGVNWTQKFPQTSPLGRTGQAMAYDAARRQVIMFGGTISTANYFANDTWIWDGSNWSQKAIGAGPAGRHDPAMAYDAAHAEVVLMGGFGAVTPILNDTWTWDGSTWAQKFPQTNMSARAAAALAYDSSHSQVVLFGGVVSDSNSITVNNETWVWDGSNWSKKSLQTNPPRRSNHALAYDSSHGQVLMFGGADGFANVFGDTWLLSGGVGQPAISGVVSASGFGGFPAVAPGSWVEIYGSNLAAASRIWGGADFNGNNAPTSLDGVQVSIGGQKGFVDYISPTQVNAQLPSGIGMGAQQIVVTNGTASSAPLSIIVNSTQPGLLAPAVFQINGNQYVVGLLQDGNYVLPVGAIPGVASRPAKSGETILLFGVGFGSVTPDIAAGQIVTEGNQLSAPLQIKFGGTQAQVSYDGLGPGFVGLYQFNVVVPTDVDNDLVPLTFTLGGVAGSQTLYISVRR